MREQFSDSTRRMMQFANQEAQRFNHEYVGTEHVLLGLMRMPADDPAIRVLAGLGVPPSKIQEVAEKLMQSGPDRVAMGELPRTPRAKEVIDSAIEEARRSGDSQTQIGTEHFLIALFLVDGGVAAVVLRQCGLTLDKVREAIHLQNMPDRRSRQSYTILPSITGDPGKLLTHLGQILTELTDVTITVTGKPKA